MGLAGLASRFSRAVERTRARADLGGRERREEVGAALAADEIGRAHV